MQYAVMTFMFEKWCAEAPANFERMVAGFAALGVQAIEPFHTTFAADPRRIERTRKALGDSGLRVSAVDVICDLVQPTAEGRSKAREDLRRGLEISVALGAEVAHVAGHAAKEGIALPDARRMIADELSREAPFAAQHGLTLAIEDFGIAPTLICRAVDCLETLEYSRGSVKFLFDTGNFEFVGECADENLGRLYERVCYVHFKDWRRARDRRPGDTDCGLSLFGCPLGEGIVPNAQVAQQLKARGYSGWAALESGALLADPVSTVRRDLAALRRWTN